MKSCEKGTHEEIKNKLFASQSYIDKVEAISRIFSLLGDQNRMKIILALMEGELCVYHICEIIGSSQSAVSQHLRKLKDAKIVKSQKIGNQVLYSIADEHIFTIVNTALEHKEC